MSYTPKIPQAVSLASPSLSDLRAHRAELNARLSKDLDALRAKEESHDTGDEYLQGLQVWLSILCEYEGVCDQIATLRAQAAKPAPPPTPPPAPSATPAPPRQLGLFAGTVVTAYAGR
ncbi:MAG: hypothetical protein FJZ90_14215 [Chloroflexi bacterium]|nr:hypothetical protein [Chloroflexota bacterium]